MLFVTILGEEVAWSRWRRAFIAAVALLAFFTILVSLYAFLRPPADILLQGRYLVPVWLLLLLSVYGTRLLPRYRGHAVVTGGAVLMMVVDLQTLALTYNFGS